MALTKTVPFLWITAVLLVAAISDLRWRKIPNWLTYPTMIAAIIYHASRSGLTGGLFSLEGIALGTALLIIPYLMGGMGAGDVKLLGAVGGLVGPQGVFLAFLFSAIVGGIYALVLLAFHGYFKETALRYWTILRSLILSRKIMYIPAPEKMNKHHLLYGLAIALGTFLSFSLRGFLDKALL